MGALVRWYGGCVGAAGGGMHVIHTNYGLCLFLNKTFSGEMNCAISRGFDFLQH
jgi:hypothetical protein